MAQPLGRLYRENQDRRIEEETHSITLIEQGCQLFAGHGLPPVLVEYLDPAPQRAECALFAGGLFGRDNVHDGDAAPAYGYRFPLLGSPDEPGQLIFGIGYA